MMPRLERGAVILTVASSVAFGCPASAQSRWLDQAGFYRPGSAPQSPPLRVEVFDGRRFRNVEIGAVYRLYGIDTCAPGRSSLGPLAGMTCQGSERRETARLGRQPWPCGAMATSWLVAATLNKWLSCVTIRDEAGEHLSRCASAAHPDLAADMISDGVAVTLPPTEKAPEIRAYAAAEREDRKAYRGLWANTFERPWEFRADFAQRDTTTPGREAGP